MHIRCCQIYSILSRSALKQDPIAAFIKESKNSNTQKTNKQKMHKVG